MSEEGEKMDPVLMQNFPAEARAVEYERRLTRTGGWTYRPLHPRVVTLLEDPIALRQFIYLYLLNMINENERDTRHPGIYRWQLEWERATGPQTIWLTRGWNPDRDKTKRPNKPDIFNAIHGYAVRKQTYEPMQPGTVKPYRNDKIDSKFAQLLIDRKMEGFGVGKEIEALRANLDETGKGLIAYLIEKSIKPDTMEVIREDYADLAAVMKMLIQDRLEEIKIPETRKGTKTTTGEAGRIGFDDIKSINLVKKPSSRGKNS